jgi:hypothetical protein
MADIISFQDRQFFQDEKKAADTRKEKFQAFQRSLQCSRCPSRCEKCGVQIDMTRSQKRRREKAPRIPHRLCDGCLNEYTDYLKRLNGGSDPGRSWQNQEWADIWKRWIEYQKATNRYLRSKDFLLMVQELHQTAPDK